MRGSAPLPRPRPLRRHTYSERANHTRPAPDVDRLCPPRHTHPAWIGDTNPALRRPTGTGGTALGPSPHAHRRTRPRPTHPRGPAAPTPRSSAPPGPAVPAQRTPSPRPNGWRSRWSPAGRWWRAHSSPHRDRRKRTGFKPPRAPAYPPTPQAPHAPAYPPAPHGPAYSSRPKHPTGDRRYQPRTQAPHGDRGAPPDASPTRTDAHAPRTPRRPAVPTRHSSTPPGSAKLAPHSLPPRRPRALAGDQFRERYLDRAR